MMRMGFSTREVAFVGATRVKNQTPALPTRKKKRKEEKGSTPQSRGQNPLVSNEGGSRQKKGGTPKNGRGGTIKKKEGMSGAGDLTRGRVELSRKKKSFKTEGLE